MKRTQKQIAELFSNGDFKKTFDYLSENIEWETINQFHLKGKSNVIEKCNETSEYFKTITTDFKQLDLMETYNKVVITGTAEFTKQGKRLEFISACDIYDFNEHSEIKKITSYCLTEK